MSSSESTVCTESIPSTQTVEPIVFTIFYITGGGSWKQSNDRKQGPSFNASVQTKAEVPLAIQTKVDEWRQMPEDSPNKAYIKTVIVRRLSFTLRNMKTVMKGLLNGQGYSTQFSNTASEDYVIRLMTPEQIDTYLYE